MQWAGGHGRQGTQQQPSPAGARQRYQQRSASRGQQQQQQQQMQQSRASHQAGLQQATAQSRLMASSSQGEHSQGSALQPCQGQHQQQQGGQSQRPEWLNEYDLVGKIGEGTYGLVYLAKNKDKSKGSGRTAIKKFKQAKEGEGVSPTAIREIMLLRECSHDNIVKLVNVHINHYDMSLYLAFDYAEHDFYEIIRYHRDVMKCAMKEYTIKSFLWQLLNGLNYLHRNWIIHRDLKPSNILVMGEGEEQGVVKIADFGLARIFQAPLRPLCENGVVVTIWYRAPELLLGSKHYTCAVDMWAVGCIFAEMLALKPLFQGIEDKTSPNAFQKDQLDKIFKVMGHPTSEKWPMLQYLPFWQDNRQLIQERRYDHPTLKSVLPPTISEEALSLLCAMLEYDPKKRLTAAEALEHRYFKCEPLPGRNSFFSGNPGEKTVPYPQRPVDRNIDFEKAGQLPQQQQAQQQQHVGQMQQSRAHQHGLQGSLHQEAQLHGSSQDQHGPCVGSARLPPSQQQHAGSRPGMATGQGRTTRERSSLGSSGSGAPPNKTRRIS